MSDPVRPSTPPRPHICVGRVRKMEAICTWLWHPVPPFSTCQLRWGGTAPSTWHCLWAALWTPLGYYVGWYFGFFGSQHQLMPWVVTSCQALFLTLCGNLLTLTVVLWGRCCSLFSRHTWRNWNHLTDRSVSMRLIIWEERRKSTYVFKIPAKPCA